MSFWGGLSSPVAVLHKMTDKRCKTMFCFFYRKFREHRRFVYEPVAEYSRKVEMDFEVVFEQFQKFFTGNFPDLTIVHDNG